MRRLKNLSWFPVWLLHLAIIFFIVLSLLTISIWAWDKHFENKIYPGVKIGTLDLGGLTADNAEKNLAQRRDELEQTGIVFDYSGHTKTLLPVVASADADLAYNLIEINLPDTIDQAMAFGRTNDLLANLKNQLSALMFDASLKPIINLDIAAFKNNLIKNFSEYESPTQNAQLIFNPARSENREFSVSPEKVGQIINYDQAIDLLKDRLAKLDFSPINLSSTEQQPDILATDSLPAQNEAEEFLKLAPLTLTAGSSSWPIGKNQLGTWLGLENRSQATGQNQPQVGLNQTVVKKYLSTVIASQLNKNPEEAKFQMSNGRVDAFQTSQDGQALNITSSTEQLENLFIKNRQSQIGLIIDKIPALTNASSTDNLGITEIIGTGHSVFSGSPKNRRINIAVGANALNGLLIKPGEVFSVINALGKIDASTGYLQELVIKGDKTIPEYGGGLCQIGTTMFRTALASGLPINERQNHSYRVAYYEPAGTDATIYDPSPDLKFTNDTNNYILIQSRLAGDNLYFDFWGTKDGRVATTTYPTIYNIVKPKPGKVIETTDLPVGQKKCTEKAHNGADAFFNYQVTYADGAVKQKKFTSHYVPWQEVCLLGVDKLSTTTAVSTVASSTPITQTTP